MNSISKIGVTLENSKLIYDITYNDLYNLLINNGLVEGRKYLITDYQTVHIIPSTADLNIGPIEPLLVTATSVNTLSPISYSILYPTDTIFYNISNTDTYKVQGQTKGFIDRRIDNYNNIDVPFDFRNVKFRRWEVNVTNIWDNSTIYDNNSVVVQGSTIYLSTIDNNVGNDPSLNTYHWFKFPFNNGLFVSHTPTKIILYDHDIFVSSNYQDKLINVNNNVKIEYGGYYGNANKIEKFNLVFNTLCTDTTIKVISASGTIDKSANNTINCRQFTSNYIDQIYNVTTGRKTMVQVCVNNLYDCEIHGVLSSSNIHIIHNCHFLSSSFVSGLVVNNRTTSLSEFSFNTFKGFINGLRLLYDNNNIKNLTIKDADSTIYNVDFSAATIIFGDYSKEILKDSSGVPKIIYLDGVTGQITSNTVNA